MESYTSHYKSILRLGLPIVIGQVGIILVSFADNIMVSRHSTFELAAASFVNNFLNLAIIFGMGFSYGLTPLVASSYAKQKIHDAVHWLGNSLFTNAVIGGVIALVLIGLQPYIYLFNISNELLPLVLPYYRLQVIAFFVAMLFNGFKQFFEGMSQTTLPMYISLGGNLINILLNYFLIYGIWIFPEWGLYGAGIATLASRIIMLLASVLFMALFPYWRPLLKHLFLIRLEAKRIIRLIKIGSPVAVQMGLEAASFSIAVVFVAKLGTDALAAHQIISVITTLGFLVYYGIGAATSIRVSIFKAQGKVHELRKITYSAYHICALVAVAMIVSLSLFKYPITALFKADSTITEYVIIALIPVFLYQFGDALQIIYANALRGISYVKRLASWAFVCHIVIAPLLCYFFGFVLAQDSGVGTQLAAIWTSFPFSLSILGLMLLFDFRKATRY